MITSERLLSVRILAGDFNCPDIDWENMSVKQRRCRERFSKHYWIEHGLTKVHDQPTRDINMLNVVFTNNPSTVKTSTSIPGISDHAMIVTDIDIIPQYVKQRQRKFYIFSKANWDNIQEDMCKISDSIIILSKAPLLKNYGRPVKMASSILWTGTFHPK